MKDGNSKGLILTFSVICLLILSSVETFGTSVNSDNEGPIQVTSLKLKSSTIAIRMNSQSIQTSTVKTSDNDFIPLDIEDFNNTDNKVIAGTEGNESYPSMIVSGANAFIAYEYRDNGDPYIYLRNSGDLGQNWSINGEQLLVYLQSVEISVNSPALCVKPGKTQAYGIFFSKVYNSGIFGGLDIPDIKILNQDNIDKKIWDFSTITNQSSGEYLGSFWNFSDPDIVYHEKTGVPWISAFIGTTNYTDEDGDFSAKDTLFFSFLDAGSSSILWIQWDHNLEDCSNLSLAMDDTNKKLYGVCELKNGSKNDLMFFKGSHVAGPSIDVEYFNISSSVIDHAHPKIYVKDEDIYIASEIEIAGVYDIIIYNSSNDGETWGNYDPTGLIMAPPGEYIPKNPTILANETDIFCNFIEDKNLSITISNDSGANWADPIQINSVNGSVVEEYRFSDMPSDNHIVWTDDRDGNLDIYGIVKSAPEFNIAIVPGSFKLVVTDFPFLRTKNYVTYKIINIGEHPVSDLLIEVTVNRSGNTPFTTDYPGFIKHLEPGEELEFMEPLFRITLGEFLGALLAYIGVDNIKLEVIPRGAFPDSDPSDNTADIEPSPVKYSDIFPFFSIFGA
jgi:hypothetical protein